MIKRNFKNSLFGIVFLAFLTALLILTSDAVSASRIDDLRQKIDDNNAQITQIQKEIDELQKQLDETSQNKKTLQNQINQLTTTIKNLKANINLTSSKITAANLNIEQLNEQIQIKEGEIAESKEVLAETIRNMNEAESKSLVEILLANASLSDFYGDIERIKDYQETINASLGQLKELKNDLQEQEAAKEAEKNNLVSLQSQLTDQKKITEAQNNQKNTLLKETQNKETTYQKQLAEQIEKQKALGDEIRAFEEEIRIIIDPKSLPPAGMGVLKWPLDEITITQEFGWTPYALAHPWLYPKDVGHNGVDFRAAVGTPVKAAGDGIVKTGDTDIGCKGVSYGKWVLIMHPNNLSSLYAHLSRIIVVEGQEVKTGQVIGYSGDTGIADGPHLHFGVIATQAIIGFEYKSKVCGRIMKLPLVSSTGYLNPLSYL
jgi:murein DD-endopeptidase MepM/ murein hydrolase activator NlpD